MDGFPDRSTVVMPFPGYTAYAFAFNEEGPADFFFPVHSKHPFPPVTGFSSSIPDYPAWWVAFRPSPGLMVGAFYPSIHTVSHYPDK
jgi:hypothetical protein